MPQGDWPVMPPERGDDLHNLEAAETADLVLFMAGNQFMDMYRQAGGEALVRRIMQEKRSAGTNLMTVVHHRKTPHRIVNREADVGPVWVTEIMHAKSLGLPIESVEPGEALGQRDRINYTICRLKSAPHPENAQTFLSFVLSPAARAIYTCYGFIPHRS